MDLKIFVQSLTNKEITLLRHYLQCKNKNYVKNLHDDKGNFHDNFIDNLFDVIKNEFYITKERILYGNDRCGGNRMKITHICAYILKEYTNYSQVEIAGILNKNKSEITRYLYSINQAFKKPENKNNQEIIKKIEIVKKQLNLK